MEIGKFRRKSWNMRKMSGTPGKIRDTSELPGKYMKLVISQVNVEMREMPGKQGKFAKCQGKSRK